MKAFQHLIALILIFTLVGCGESKDKKAHRNLANNFVNALNMDGEYDVELIKTYTRQKDFIVVQDKETGEFNAYDLSNYKAGDDIYEFLSIYANDFYYDLERTVVVVYEEDPFSDSFNDDGIYVGPSYDLVAKVVYVDPASGLRFSKKNMTTADTAKAQELVDGLKIQNATNQLTVQFGLPPARAKQVAGLALQLAGADKTKMTVYQYDQYAKAVLGTTITDIHSAVDSMVSGDSRKVESIYEKAAKANGISKDSVKKLAETFLIN